MHTLNNGKKRSMSLSNQKGSFAILLIVVMFVLLGLAAISIDTGLLAVVRNELQNASDAGALAGAANLYTADGQINTGANQIAYDASRANDSMKTTVDIDWADGSTDNGPDIERGHWSFATRTFTPNPSTVEVDLWDVSEAALDANTNFINAVRVTARRSDTPAPSFFGRFLGHESYEMATDSIAYIGYASDLTPGSMDIPLAICIDSVTDGEGLFTCKTGKRMTSGNDLETAAWTDYVQPEVIDPDKEPWEEPNGECASGTNATDLKPLVTEEGIEKGNPFTVYFGLDMQVINGEVTSVFADFWDRWWENSKEGTLPWNVNIPIIECKTSGKVLPCQKLVGVANVNIIWVNDQIHDKDFDHAPELNGNTYTSGAPVTMEGFGQIEGMQQYKDFNMADTVGQPGDGAKRWAKFVENFNLDLMLPQGTDPAEGWTKNTVFFVPNCDVHAPEGITGGRNFGILAKIPKLVE